MSNITTKWPPTEEQIQNIAVNALNTSQDKDVKVLDEIAKFFELGFGEA